MIEPAARGAWPQLALQLRPFIARRVATEDDADDVLQDVFLRLQRGLPKLRDEERFGPWVYQVARSAIIDHLRQRAAASRLVAGSLEELDEVKALGPASDDGDGSGRAQELARSVAPFVAMLPSPYREALTLTELEGLTQKEAAELLGISLSGMKSRVQRGRVLLRRALEDCCHIALDARGGVMDFSPRPDGRLPASCCRTAQATVQAAGASKR